MTKILIFIIKIYQYFISPLLGSRCRYLPSCSDYFIEALKKLGFVKGTYLGTCRILRCHPFKKLGGGHGIDFLPIPKNTDRKIRLKKIINGLQKAGWKLKNQKESKHG